MPEADTVSPLTLRLFGPFEARLHGQPLPRLRSCKGQWLLALLTLRHGCEVNRAWLAGTLWPDSSEEAAYASLRNSLKDLRRALGTEAGRLRAPTPRTLALDLEDVDADVIAFDQAIAQGEEGALERAVHLCRGPLLEGCLEEWVLPERDTREQACLAALETLAARALERGDPSAAERHLRQAVTLDPLRETAQRALMRVLAAGGSYASAVQVYRELRLRLHRELNTAPDPETQVLYQQMRTEAREKATTGSLPAGAKPTAGRGCDSARRAGGDGGAPPAKPVVKPDSISPPVAPLPDPPRSARCVPPVAEVAPSQKSPSLQGTVTFLFTDIEGSSQLWERDPEAMKTALSRHDALLHLSIEAHGGFVFKTVGDAFYAAFATAPAAVAAALAAQQALLTKPWRLPDPAGERAAGEVGPLRVRMALHTGIAEAREGDYFGPTLNRVARLLDAGHGGQVLLSLPTEELVRDALPDGASLRPLGEHRLKDLTRPEQLFQLLDPDLPSAFPPLRSLAAFTHNLPLQWTRFVGREREIEQVKQWLPTTPLLTLTGPGGCGKTRLALQVAAELLDAYPDGVWLVELAALAEPSLVPPTVAAALGVPEQPGRSLTTTLIEHLRTRALLLVLDNCEHLLAACGALVDALLRACPQVRILATSRERLGLTGERVYLVPSLSVPGPSQLPSLERLQQFEAVQLFADRATLSQPAFAVTEANAPAVVQICQRLDGVPLAIELAAARVKALPVERIAERLDDRFRLLTGGSRTALPRQQTLRALIDWSYDLLSGSERRLLCRLSVFAGGWTLEAAEGVYAGDGIEEWEVLDLLTQLVEKSLVVYEEQAGEARYRLLETVRQYGRDRLLESGEGEAVRDRHFAYFLGLAEQEAPDYPGQASVEWLERLEQEHDNLRAALAWRLAGGESAADGLRLVVALWIFWLVRGHLTEGQQWVQKALENSQPAPQLLQARALLAAGFLAWYRGEYAVAQQVGQESLALWREEGDQHGMAFALALSGKAAHHGGSVARAVALMEECLALARGAGAKWPEQLALFTLGHVAMEEGDLERATVLAQEGLGLVRDLGEKLGIAYGLCTLGALKALQGHYEQARASYMESLIRFQEVGERRGIAHSLDGLAKLACVQGRPKQAAGLYGAAQVLREAIGAGLTVPERQDQATHLDLARAALGEAAFAAAWAEGRAMTLEQAIAYALEKKAAD